MTPGSTAQSQALRRQQAALTALLRVAGVPPEEAEALLLGVLRAIPAEVWEQKPQEDLDLELRLRVAAACRRYADKNMGAERRLVAGALSLPGLVHPIQQKKRRWR